MVLSNWLCSNSSTKEMFVKIVHPGGLVELYDKPVLAGEIMLRNPKFCVAHPNVFEQPWAIVAPETMLMLGEKFYVVPTGTIRKLQRHSPKNSSFSSPLSQEMNKSQIRKEEGEDHDGSVFSCWLYRLCSCKKHCDRDEKKKKVYKSCYTRKSIGNDDVENRGNLCRENELLRKKSKEFSINGKKGSPKRFASFDQWQPSLESITEE